MSVSSSLPPFGELPRAARQRMGLARARLREAAERGIRVVIYELALELDMSEYHFARMFRAEFGYAPHEFYDEVRAAVARDLLREGAREGTVARRIGLRRPAELRRLLRRRSAIQSVADVKAQEASI